MAAKMVEWVWDVETRVAHCRISSFQPALVATAFMWLDHLMFDQWQRQGC